MELKLGDISAHYDGKGEILFVHGAGMDGRVFERQKNLGIALDLPNHGGSGSLEVTSLKDYAEFLIEFVNELGINPVVAGHSMGGAVVQEYLFEGGKARGAILISTGAKLPVNPKLIEGLKENFDEMVEKISGWLFSRNFDVKGAINRVKKIMNENRHSILEDFLMCDKFNRESFYEGIADFGIPVVVICGNEDVMTPPEYSEFLRERIEGSRLVLMHRTGHMPMVEKPSVFNKVVREFLKSID